MKESLDLLGIEAAWRDGEFNDAEDAVRHAQHAISKLIAELRVSRRVVEAAQGLLRTLDAGNGADRLEMMPLRAALYELSTLNAISDTEPPSRRAGAFDVKQEYR